VNLKDVDDRFNGEEEERTGDEIQMVMGKVVLCHVRSVT
jgi:hypothetical protein